MLHAPVAVDPSMVGVSAHFWYGRVVVMPSRRSELATVLGTTPKADAPNQEVTTGEAAKDDHE